MAGEKKEKFFKWTVEIKVSETWVADGFEADAESIGEAINVHLLTYAYPEEIKTRILSRPPDKSIATAQGYKTIKAWKAATPKDKR